MADSPLADSPVPALIPRPYFILAARFMLRLNLLRSTPHAALYGATLRRLPH